MGRRGPGDAPTHAKPRALHARHSALHAGHSELHAGAPEAHAREPRWHARATGLHAPSTGPHARSPGLHAHPEILHAPCVFKHLRAKTLIRGLWPRFGCETFGPSHDRRAGMSMVGAKKKPVKASGVASARARRATKASGGAKKTVAKKKAAKKGEGLSRGAVKQAVAMMLLMGTNDEKRPMESPAAQAAHSEALAGVVRRRIKVLGLAKVTIDEATMLEVLAKDLRAAEASWRAYWVAGGDKPLAKAREEAIRGRKDLFSALRTFAANDAATQAALDDVGSVEDDADLLQDLAALIPLAKKHKDDLEGTDVDEGRRGEIEVAEQRFRTLRVAGAVPAGAAEGDAEGIVERAGALSEKGRELFHARNRTYWALVNVDRAVRDKARHAFRHEPKVLGEFASLTNHRTAGKWKKKEEEEGGGEEGGGEEGGGEKK